MADPIIHGPALSTYARSVRLALEENGISYKLNEVNVLGAIPPDHLKRQPFGKVPAFEHDGFALHETQAINRYIDETFGGKKLQPADAKKRARMNQIIGILDSYGYPSMISAVVIERVVKPMMKAEPDEAKIKGAMPLAETSLDALEGLIGRNQFLAGEEISLADLHAVPIFEYFSQTPEGKTAIAKRPNVAAWWSRIKDRPSCVKTRPQLG
ncbi:MAG: glutathione S-transferase family protein [Alphaproteobacteria bacterium]|nr:glutathione S-transferase family protein [Alphaproteobacteria bacterium]